MLLVVNRRNPYFKNGAKIRKFDDGWEEVVLRQVPGTSRWEPAGYRGLVIPFNVIDMTKYAVPILANQAPPPEYMHRQKRLVLS